MIGGIHIPRVLDATGLVSLLEDLLPDAASLPPIGSEIPGFLLHAGIDASAGVPLDHDGATGSGDGASAPPVFLTDLGADSGAADGSSPSDVPAAASGDSDPLGLGGGDFLPGGFDFGGAAQSGGLFITGENIPRLRALFDTLGLDVWTDGGPGADMLSGTDSFDFIDGHGGDDVISGGADDDFLVGGEGNDILNGGAGSDSLFGDAGDDTLSGGAGLDILTGGAGADTFHFAAGEGADAIVDFVSGADKIALDRASFGLAADATVADVVRIGGEVPTSGEFFYVSQGFIVFDHDWSDAAGREVVGFLVSGRPALADFEIA